MYMFNPKQEEDSSKLVLIASLRLKLAKIFINASELLEA